MQVFNRKRHCIPREQRGPDGLVKCACSAWCWGVYAQELTLGGMQVRDHAGAAARPLGRRQARLALACAAGRCAEAEPGCGCRDVELAKFQSFLEREKAQDIESNVRSVQPLAYPISGCAPAPSTAAVVWKVSES